MFILSSNNLYRACLRLFNFDYQVSLFTVLLLTLIGKTAATVPSGAIVVLLAAAPQLGLPVEGVALIFAVDFFVNAGRTMINVLGQILTVSVIEKQKDIF